MPNFRLIYLFWRTYSPETLSIDTSFFQTAIWSISRRRTVKKKWHLWNPGIKLVQNTFLFKNNNLKIWPFVTRDWPDPSPLLTFLGSDCKIASIFEFYVQKCLENMYWPPENTFWFFIFRDHLLPDLYPDPYLVWHLCLQGISNSPLMLLWVSFE